MFKRFTSITRTVGNGSIVFGQKFDLEFSPDLHVLRSPESKKVDFRNWSVCVYVCVCMYVCRCVRNLLTTVSPKQKEIELPNFIYKTSLVYRRVF